jgi:hypothetical protein
LRREREREKKAANKRKIKLKKKIISRKKGEVSWRVSQFSVFSLGKKWRDCSDTFFLFLSWRMAGRPLKKAPAVEIGETLSLSFSHTVFLSLSS